MAGEPVGPKPSTVSRLHVVQQTFEPGDRFVDVDGWALAVGVVQPVVLHDAQDSQGPGEFVGPDGGEGGPRFLGAAFVQTVAGIAAGGGHTHHPLAEVCECRQHATREIGLVIGVREDRNSGAQRSDPVLLVRARIRDRLRRSR